MIGVNSAIVKEFNPSGVICAKEVKLIELSLADTDFTRDGFVERAVSVRDAFGVEYTVHAPYQNSSVERLRIRLSEIRPENLKVMERVFEVCDRIEARRIVVHAGDLVGSLERSLRNVVRNLKVICRMGRDYEIALENLYTENGVRRVCETPDEMLYVLENVNADNLCVNLDIGHAFLCGRLEEFLERLDGHIRHMHIHNNYGLRDEHNPMNRGLIDPKVVRFKAEVKILEVKNGTREEIIRSLVNMHST